MKLVLQALERQLKIETQKSLLKEQMTGNAEFFINQKLPIVVDGYIEQLQDSIRLIKNRIEIESILGRNPNLQTNDLNLLRACYDSLGIEYHQLKNGESTYIRKLKNGEKKNWVHSPNGNLQVLTSPNQLGYFFEFDENDKLSSW